jgi:hypothetical protein
MVALAAVDRSIVTVRWWCVGGVGEKLRGESERQTQ